jgi:hypothetical protein
MVSASLGFNDDNGVDEMVIVVMIIVVMVIMVMVVVMSL